MQLVKDVEAVQYKQGNIILHLSSCVLSGKVNVTNW